MNNIPLVSFCVLAYNQESFIGECVRSALAQDYGRMEIILSDDGSSDRTYEIIKEIVSKYQGGHNVIINRNENNLGIIRHVNKVVYELAHGEIVVLMAGDDVSVVTRTSDSVKMLKDTGLSSLTMNLDYIGSGSEELNRTLYKPNDKFELFYLSNYLEDSNFFVCGSSRVITRELLDFFGPFNDDAETEDTTFTLRALLFGGIVISNKIGVHYRVHENNISGFNSLYTNFHPKNIYKQYLTDLDKAYNHKVISEHQYSYVKRKIDRYLLSETLKRDIFFANGLLKKTKELCCSIKTKPTLKEFKAYLYVYLKTLLHR